MAPTNPFRRGLGAAMLLAGLLIGVAMGPSLARASGTAPEAVLDAGVVRGAAGDGVSVFKGVPYAAPPVGPLRWRPPQPVKAWTGARSADRFGPICLQRFNPADNGIGALPMSEDCLTLNVWSPAVWTGGPLPVMVWIHGGGFVNGSGSAALYDGAALARQGVVVVTLNYRLGRLGFFAHPALSREQAGGPVANYGLMDQVAALKWVRRNIAAFGGDPGNVTLMGESAGGISVNRLMLAAPARGLFHKAIVQSGLGAEPPMGRAAAERAGAAFASSLGVGPGDLKGLRALSAQRILDAGEPDFAEGFGPIEDGLYVTGRVDAQFAAGRQARVPYLVGSTALEFPWLTADRPGAFGALIPRPRGRSDPLRAAYPGETAYQANLVSDLLFTEPARFLARAQARTGQPTWLYRFSVLSDPPPKGVTATPHAQERQYVFRTLSTSPWPTTANDEARAAEVSAYWVAFARTGDPNGGGREPWPRVEGGRTRQLNFTNDGPRVEEPQPSAALDVLERLRAPGRRPKGGR